MGCLDDETLSKCLDGELDSRTDARVREHLERCGTCSGSLRILKEAGLMFAREGSFFSRANAVSGENCPDDEIVGAYADRPLKFEDSLRVEEHISSCGNCLRKFITAREGSLATVDDLRREVPVYLVEKAKSLLKPRVSKLFELAISVKGNGIRIINSTVGSLQLLGSGLSSAMEPIPVRVAMERRAGVEGVIVRQKEGGIDFRFEVVNMGEERCRVRLTLRDIKSMKPKAGLRISLCEKERILQSQPADSQGEVILENVPAGNYIVQVTDARQWEIPLSLEV